MRAINRRWDDSLVYVGLCILTLGAAFFIRVIITMAIRCAFENEEIKKKTHAGSPPDPSKEIVLNKKEAEKLKKDHVLKVFIKDSIWICPSCSDRNRDIYDVCWKCGQEVDKIDRSDSNE